MRTKLLENGVYIFLADHGSELDYLVGMLLTDLTSTVSGNKSVVELSNAANIAITVGWNYFDAIYDFMLAAKQLADTRTYRRSQSKAQAILNIISGLQLFILSYNPLFTTYLGLSNETALAGSSFAFSALFDFFVAALEFYNTQKEMEFKGWLNERVKELLYKLKNGHDYDELIKNMHYHCCDYVHNDQQKHDHVVQILQQNFPRQHQLVNPIIQNLQPRTAEHSERSRQIQQQLIQAHHDSRVNLNLKAASAMGMTLLAVTHFLDSSTLSADITLVLGLALSTYVASAYLAYNSERLIDSVSTYSLRFYRACRRQYAGEEMQRNTIPMV